MLVRVDLDCRWLPLNSGGWFFCCKIGCRFGGGAINLPNLLPLCYSSPLLFFVPTSPSSPILPILCKSGVTERQLARGRRRCRRLAGRTGWIHVDADAPRTTYGSLKRLWQRWCSVCWSTVCWIFPEKTEV